MQNLRSSQFVFLTAAWFAKAFEENPLTAIVAQYGRPIALTVRDPRIADFALPFDNDNEIPR